MKDLKYSPERLIREMMVYSGFTFEIGLMNGRAGICILLFLYSRYFDDREVEEYAEYLLDEITVELEQAGFGFENGITGIAWSINYLIAHGYVEGDSDEVLEDIDLAVQNAPNKQGLEIMSGLYWISRMPSTKQLIKQQAERWIKNILRLVRKQETKLSCADVINILYCCHVCKTVRIFPVYIRQLIGVIEPSIKRIFENSGYECEKYILSELCRTITGLQKFSDYEKSAAWNVTLSDINKLYLYRLIFDRCSFEIPECCLEKIKSIISDSDIFDGLIPLMNPENIGLKSHIGGLTLTLTEFINDRD